MINMIKYFRQLFCKHKKTFIIYICYQDRYVHTVCNNCSKEFYNDL